MLTTYRRLSAARKAANGRPIVRIGSGGVGTLYVVPSETDLTYTKLTEISVLDGVSGHVTGSVTVGHLDRLGNANHATANRSYHTKIDWNR